MNAWSPGSYNSFPRRVLVVEDDMLIGADAECQLNALGINSITMASSLSEALHRLSDTLFDFAFLDINLGAAQAYPVADELTKQNVPLVFTTGYEGFDRISEVYRHIPVITKPYTTRDLQAAIFASHPAAGENPPL